MKTLKAPVVAVLALSFASFALPADETKVVNKSYDFSNDGKVSVENINGDITISGWDKNEIALKYTITSDDEDDLKKTKVKINSSRTSFNVDVEFDHSSSGWFGDRSNSSQVDFELKVPFSAIMRNIESVNGDIAITGVEADINVDTVNGEIDVTAAANDVKFDTVNGDVTITMKRLKSGQRVKGETVNGDIIILTDKDASFSLDTDTVNGDLSNDFGIEVDEGEYVGAEMEGSYNGGDAELSFDTVNGDIEVNKK